VIIRSQICDGKLTTDVTASVIHLLQKLISHLIPELYSKEFNGEDKIL